MSAGELLEQALAAGEPLAGDAITERILTAALRQYELFGMRRSTVDDVARRAGLSRVTVYRRFPQRELLEQAVVLREVAAFLSDLREAVAMHEALEDRVVEGFVFTLDAMRSNRLLTRLLEAEPESMLPHLTLQAGPLITLASDALAVELAGSGRRPGRELRAVSELAVRLLLSLLLTPQSSITQGPGADPRAFARRHLAPMLAGR